MVRRSQRLAFKTARKYVPVGLREKLFALRGPAASKKPGLVHPWPSPPARCTGPCFSRSRKLISALTSPLDAVEHRALRSTAALSKRRAPTSWLFAAPNKRGAPVLGLFAKRVLARVSPLFAAPRRMFVPVVRLFAAPRQGQAPMVRLFTAPRRGHTAEGGGGGGQKMGRRIAPAGVGTDGPTRAFF
jgi:hypothetical protein